MNKKIEKIINGKENDLVNVYITFGESKLKSGCRGSKKLDDDFEEAYGEKYVEARERFMEKSQKILHEYVVALNEMLKEDGFDMEDAKTNKQMDKEELAKFLEKMGASKELLDKIKRAKNVEVCEVECIECGEEDEEDDE